MQLHYKVIKINNQQGTASVEYSKEHKGSEPLFVRRAAIEDAEKMRDTLLEGDGSTVMVTLCFSPIDGFVSELPIHSIGGNTDLSMLMHHCWPLEVSLYYQYQYDTGGDIANYMGSPVLYDVLEQIKEGEY